MDGRTADRLVLAIPRPLLKRMVEHCIAAYPDETCGILAGRGSSAGKIFEMTNIEPSPVSYLMDPREQFLAMKEMRREGSEMVAIFHSHPQSPAFPSQKDVKLAFYSDSFHVIVSLIDRERPEIRAYDIRDGVVREVSIVSPD